MKTNKFMWIILVVLILIALAWYFLFTQSGAQFVTRKVISEYIEHDQLNYKEVVGNLVEGITYRNLVFQDIENLPKGSTLKIQNLHISLNSLNINGLLIEVDNLRLILPDSDPLVLSGNFKDGLLNLNLFSKGFDASVLLQYFYSNSVIKNIKADIVNVDLFVKGPYKEPRMTGEFLTERLSYSGFSLQDAPVKIDIKVQKENKLTGEVTMMSGIAESKRTTLKVLESKMLFNGPVNNPSLNLNGKARINKVRINISIKGTKEAPEISLSSEPSLPKEKLLVMLATGKSWDSVDETFEKQAISPDLARDFVDYFLFAGKGDRLARKLGLSSVSLTFDNTTKGVGVSKELSEKLEVGYGVQQQGEGETSKETVQKVEGSYQVTEKVSVGVEREMKTKLNDEPTEEPAEVNDKVFFKYKRKF